MDIRLDAELEAALNEHADRQGVDPEVLVIDVLRKQLICTDPPIQPQDEWERRLFGAAIDCGISIPNSALSSDGLYE